MDTNCEVLPENVKNENSIDVKVYWTVKGNQVLVKLEKSDELIVESLKEPELEPKVEPKEPENQEKDSFINIKNDSTEEGKQVVMKPPETNELEAKPRKESELESKKERRKLKKSSLNKRIEFSQFIRSSIQSSKTKHRGSCKIILARRPTMLKLLEPDPDIFKGLDDVEPFDETLLPPLPEDCTPNIIASIKKGMLLGKLYNMPKKTLKVIYPQLSIVSNDRLVKGQGWVKKSLFRCPLCPKDFIMKTSYNYAYTHIEQYHTSSLVTCIKCHLSFTFESSVLKHRSSKSNCLSDN